MFGSENLFFCLYVAAIIFAVMYLINKKEFAFADKVTLASAFIYLTLLVSMAIEGNIVYEKFLNFRWYLAIFLLFTSVIFRGPMFKLNFLNILMLVYNLFMYLSCMQSPSPKLTFYRSAAFSLIIVTIFSLDKKLTSALIKVFWDLVYIYHTFVIVLLSIPFLLTKDFYFFEGVLNNSNGLASVIGIAVPYLFARMLYEKTRQKIYIVIFILALFVTFLAHSRNIMVGIIAGILFIIYKQKKGFLKIAVFASICLAILFYIYDASGVIGLSKSYIIKDKSLPVFSQSGAYDSTLFNAERYKNIETAKEYFLQQSLFGWGYGISPEGLYEDWQGELTISKGASREKGTSWLATLEELGIIGSLPLFICLFLLYKIIFSKINFETELDKTIFYGLCGSNIVLVISATTEAWLIAPGSVPFFIFWFNSVCLVRFYLSTKTKLKPALT